jgi:hypothetical protein
VTGGGAIGVCHAYAHAREGRSVRRLGRDCLYAGGSRGNDGLHGHLGLKLAASTGDTMAQLVAGDGPGSDPEPGRPDRFGA